MNERSDQHPREKLGFAKEATLPPPVYPRSRAPDLRDVNVWTMFRSGLAGSPCESFEYVAYDALNRVVARG